MEDPNDSDLLSIHPWVGIIHSSIRSYIHSPIIYSVKILLQ